MGYQRKEKKHLPEIMAQLSVASWETFNLNVYDREKEITVKNTMTVTGEAIAYFMLLNHTEILTNNRYSLKVKLSLIGHIAKLYDQAYVWQKQQRGRKVGIRVNLTQGFITGSDTLKASTSTRYARTYSPEDYDLPLPVSEFLIEYMGADYHNSIPKEHTVYIDDNGSLLLGSCIAVQGNNRQYLQGLID